MKTISGNEVRELIAQGNVALVEALPENHFEKEHLPGAISLPPGHVAALAPQLLPDKKQTVIVYCAGRICQNSILAAEELKNLGYSNVFRYEGGKEDWRDAGLPFESGYVDSKDDIDAA